MVIDFEVVKEFNLLENSRIIIYGTGASGIKIYTLLQLIKCEIIGFCDSDMKKKGRKIGRQIIYNANDLDNIVTKDTIIIIASVYWEEIIDNINRYLASVNICTKFACILSFMLNRNYIRKKYAKGFDCYIDRFIYSEMEYHNIVDKMNAIECITDVLNQAILVYQPGKVGSTTLIEAIEARGGYASHCHQLFTVPMINQDRKLKNWRDCAIKNFKGKIIIPLREPISRDISQYFQILWVRTADVCHGYNITDIFDGFNKIYFESLLKNTNYDEKQLMIQAVLLNHTKYGPQFDFYNEELNKFIGSDIFDYTFDTEHGYSIYHINGIDIMILQLEKMNFLENIIGEFLGIKNFKIRTSNSGNSNEFKFIYNRFKNEIKLPKGYIDFYYKNNAGFNHFYSFSQREKFKKKWLD